MLVLCLVPCDDFLARLRYDCGCVIECEGNNKSSTMAEVQIGYTASNKQQKEAAALVVAAAEDAAAAPAAARAAPAARAAEVQWVNKRPHEQAGQRS